MEAAGQQGVGRRASPKPGVAPAAAAQQDAASTAWLLLLATDWVGQPSSPALQASVVAPLTMMPR